VATTSNIEAFVARITKLADGVSGAQRAGVNAAALVMTTSIRSAMAAAGVRGGRMRGVGRSGAAVSVGFDAAASTTHPVARVRARGPLHLLERDTKAHVIMVKRARALSIARDVMAVSAAHPGSSGKHPFEKGKAAGAAASEAAFVAAARTEMLKGTA
jgi:hypothetical protein